MEDKLNKSLDSFLDNVKTKTRSLNSNEEQVCDLQTGECYVVSSKDGIVERINKTFITEDGRQLLQD